MNVCSCHVTYAFQSESTLCSCLNVKELLARSSREIWSLSDCNWTRTHNYLVRKIIKASNFVILSSLREVWETSVRCYWKFVFKHKLGPFLLEEDILPLYYPKSQTEWPSPKVASLLKGKKIAQKLSLTSTVTRKEFQNSWLTKN